jgi:glycosyltransferase involved in cell wall biosynthesis
MDAIVPAAPTHTASDPFRPDLWGFQPHHADWISDFVRIHGRPPRVLGIGNIANNGFRNAVALREYGVECDVLVYSYYHVMGCPEWEAAYFDSNGINEFYPNWSNVDLGGYERPRWFAQGHFATAVDYLIALRECHDVADELWAKLEKERNSAGEEPPSNFYYSPMPSNEAEIIAYRIAQTFCEIFPNRRDRLKEKELLESYSYIFSEIPRLKRLFGSYDVIIGYALDGLLPLLAGNRNYIAYEHGTIRAIPFQRDLVGQLCALTYGLARKVLITNCDNILAATLLGLRRFNFVPHAILETWAEDVRATDLRKQLFEDHNADFLVFHPSRQHWSPDRNPNYDKGNDIFIEGFARFVKERRPRALLVLIEWGQKVKQTQELIDRLGIAHRTIWLNPKPLRVLAEYIAASDVLADQFTIGAWGGIMPIGLLLGTPTLIYLNDEMHRWCFNEIPPILNARTPDLVFARLVEIQNKERAAAVANAGSAWYRRYHSVSVVAGRLLDAIIPIVGSGQATSEFALNEPDDLTHQALRHLTLQLDLLDKRTQRLGTDYDGFTERSNQILEAQLRQANQLFVAYDQQILAVRSDLGLLQTFLERFERRYRIFRLVLFPVVWLAKHVRRFFFVRSR